MTQSESEKQNKFVSYWRKYDTSNKVPRFNEKTLEKIANVLIGMKYNNEDIRKIDFDKQTEIAIGLLGDYNKQYDPEKVLQPEITKAINVGKKRIGKI